MIDGRPCRAWVFLRCGIGLMLAVVAGVGVALVAAWVMLTLALVGARAIGW